MDLTQPIADRMVDLRGLAHIPSAFLESLGLNGARGKTIDQLVYLIEAILAADSDSSKLRDVSFSPCYQLGRDHRSHWTGSGAQVSNLARETLSPAE